MLSSARATRNGRHLAGRAERGREPERVEVSVGSEAEAEAEVEVEVEEEEEAGKVKYVRALRMEFWRRTSNKVTDTLRERRGDECWDEVCF